VYVPGGKAAYPSSVLMNVIPAKVAGVKRIVMVTPVSKTGEIPNIYPTVEVKIIDHRITEKPKFKEVQIENELEKELEPFLEYSSQVKIGDWYYSIKLRQSYFERADLALILALFLFILLLSAFAISYLITGKMNKSIWCKCESCSFVELQPPYRLFIN